MKDKIWFEDPMVFLDVNKLPDFIPLPSMTFVGKLNAIMRFSLYFAILLLVTQNSPKVMYIPVFVSLFTFGLYKMYENERNEFYSRQMAQNMRYDENKKESCVLPSKNNPFTNILVSDYVLNPTRKPGCKITKPSVKKMAEDEFSRTLYMDVDDIWSTNSSSRMFYQTPIQTIPNDQGKFAQWLYGRSRSCKECNGDRCLMNQM